MEHLFNYYKEEKVMRSIRTAEMSQVKGGDLECAVFLVAAGTTVVIVGGATGGLAALFAAGFLLSISPC